MEIKYNKEDFTLDKFKEIMNHYFNERKVNPFKMWETMTPKAQELFHEAIKKRI